MSSKYDEPQPQGYALERIVVDESSALVNVWEDGTRSGPTNTIGDAVAYRQRARAIAAHLVFKRKRRLWPIPRI